MLLMRALRQLSATDPTADCKRPRRALSAAAEPDRERDQLWSGLAELYGQYGDRAAALSAEARCYEQTIGRGEDPMSDQAYFQCLSELSEWGRLSRAVDQRLTAGSDQQPRLDTASGCPATTTSATTCCPG